MKVLILGGYGIFGGRLAQLLADESRLILLIAGRSLVKAEEFCRQMPAAAKLLPQVFDRDGHVEAQLKNLMPDIVVDASGPFQEYGDNPYRVVKACIALGIHYLDLADGSDFVKAIKQFDEQAKARNITVLSGVSSFPVLTAAVVAKLSVGLVSVDSITGGIAPSPYAGVGLNVIRAIASYAGQPVALLRDGKPAQGYGLSDIKNYTICPPGKLPLHHVRFSLVDVPDLQVIPEIIPGLQSIWMGAGPVPQVLHRMLNGLAWLVRCKIIPSLLPFAPMFYHAINILRWGEHRGGMFVSVEGKNAQGELRERSWHLLAEGSDGPLIPSMAIEAIIRHMLDGRMPQAGARPALTDLTLEDYDALFKRRTIYTGFRGMLDLPQDTPIYQAMLENVWDKLPQELRVMHTLHDTLTATGAAEIERGNGMLAKLVAWLFGFPQAGSDVPVKVSFRREGDNEIWQRNFAGKAFSSVQSIGKGRWYGLMKERFGPLTFGLALVVAQGKMRLIIRRWSFLGLPLPLWLAPTGEASEYAEAGRFRFHVEIAHPLIGLVVRYRGWLEAPHA